jgi:AcrR family transcriptional regulator
LPLDDRRAPLDVTDLSQPNPKRRGRPPAGGREAIIGATLDLLRERGIARLTTREVAERAGVSEASVYYHYTDKAGLLRAVFAAGLEPLQQFHAQGLGEGDARSVMDRMAHALERFLDLVLPVIMAAQSDAELRASLAVYMKDENLGPHRGVQALGRLIAAEQAAGRMRAGADPEAAALLLVGACFMRVAQRHILGKGTRTLPSLDDVVATLDGLLEP